MALFSLPDPGRGGRPLRVAYGRIFHEANTFSPLVTGREAFDNGLYLAGDDLARATTLRGSELPGFFPHAELTGFVQAARAAGGVETVPLASYMAVPSGPITRVAFESILEDQLDRLSRAQARARLDGVYLDDTDLDGINLNGIDGIDLDDIDLNSFVFNVDG